MKDFKELKVWTKAHEAVIAVYKVSRSFPRDEMYGLTSQMRRAAVSVGANIAEGCGRRSDGEFVRFLQIARGSSSELEYHLLVARDLAFLSSTEHQQLEKKVAEVQRMLTSLVSAVEQNRTGSAVKTKAASASPGASS